MITTMADLREQNVSEVIISGFRTGTQITVQLRRPSLMQLVVHGDVPNPLLGTASKMFKGEAEVQSDDGPAFKSLAEMMHIVCTAALVQPTMQELQDNGLSLTDQQMMDVYNYAVAGVTAYKPFRDSGRRTAAPATVPDSEG